MALSKPCATDAVLGTHAVPPAPASSGGTGALPLDAVHEILLRVPARALCRLRAVCRPWRALLSDPRFAAAHAARHPRDPPLLVAGYAPRATNNSAGVLADILDLSGRVVKRVLSPTADGAAAAENQRVVSAGLDLIFVVASGDDDDDDGHATTSCRLLDPATGAAGALPRGVAEEHAAHERDVCRYSLSSPVVALGRVAATGERKALRVLDCSPRAARRQLYEIATLDGDGHARRWRAATAPPYTVAALQGEWPAAAVIDGVVYFLSTELVHGQDAMPDRVASFDLATERWRPTIRGPISSSLLLADDAVGHLIDDLDRGELALAILNGRLAVTHRTVPRCMDVWILTDAEEGVWVRRHSLQQLRISFRHGEHTVRPLWELDDGRIVLVHIGNSASLKVYNPRTGTSTDVAEIGPCVAVGLYTGSVLSLAANGGM